MAQFARLQKYNNTRNHKRTIDKATHLYNKYQSERHRKRIFSKDISEYRESIKTFQAQFSNVAPATIKQMYLETYREEIDAEAPDNLFDDVVGTNHEDNETPPANDESVNNESDEDSSLDEHD